MSEVGAHRIEVVRGQLDDARAEQILSFWSEQGAIEGDAAQARLQEVVCVVLDQRDRVVGVNSVYDAPVPLIGNRRFWVYRRLVDPDVDEQVERAMIEETHQALEREFAAGDGGDPVGLCLLISDPEIMRRHPEAVWPGVGMMYAGYLEDGRQVRLGYFEGARI